MSELLSRGRGLLAVDAAASPALRRTVLETPGLGRCVGGVLLEPDMLDGGVAGPVARGCAVGVALDAGDLPQALRDPSGFLAQRMAAWAGAGVTFSGWTAEVDDGDPDTREEQANMAASWALACRETETVPLLRCRAPVPPRAPLGAAQARLRNVVELLLATLEHRGVDPAGMLLEIDPVLPGSRHAEVASPDDAARATVRALREGGVGEIGGVVLRAPHRLSDLPAHLDAVVRSAPAVRWGFGVELSALVPARAARRGQDRAVQYEVRTRLDGLVRVLRAGAAA
ncbi:class I fructose-bisphosphate aldolase [Pseudonocardia sp.]|uniref:class I fructose-bisphosphate aldolase n=1 Tax=Pseudonocardia sp. TaxID=60912 RepID=UPI003D13DD79